MFFFKQKTAYEMRISDWSSDVCSSDLHGLGIDTRRRRHLNAARLQLSENRTIQAGRMDMYPFQAGRAAQRVVIARCEIVQHMLGGSARDVAKIGRAHV